MEYAVSLLSSKLSKRYQYDNYLKNGGAYMAQNKVLSLTNNDDDSKIGNIATQAKSVTASDTTNIDKIKDKINSIKTSYQSQRPTVDWSQYDDLVYKEYTAPTQSELEATANKNLEDYKQSSIDKILLDYESDKKDLQANLDDNETALVSGIEKSNYNARANTESLQQKAISQGIERSSIVANNVDNIEDERIENIQKLKSDYQSALDSLTLKQNIIETEKELALEKFDISYASKLNTEINNLKKQSANIEAEIADYNAAIDKRKQEIQEQFDKDNATVIKNLEDSMERDIAIETFNILKTLPKTEAQAIVRDPEIAEALGDWLSIISIWLRDY